MDFGANNDWTEGQKCNQRAAAYQAAHFRLGWDDSGDLKKDGMDYASTLPQEGTQACA